MRAWFDAGRGLIGGLRLAAEFLAPFVAPLYADPPLRFRRGDAA